MASQSVGGRLLGLFALIGLFLSCSKNSGVKTTSTTTTTTAGDTSAPLQAAGIYNKLIHVVNFPGDTSSAVSSGSSSTPTSAAVCYFSLEDTSGRTSAYKKTAKWDLAFANLYNSFLSGNNGSNTQNYGAGSGAAGGIYVIAKPFDSVTDIPSDALFSTGADVYGTDASGDFGVGLGWYFYDFTGTDYPGGDGQAHICYALADRTVIVRTAIGNYAKIKMISLYKDSPAAPTTYSPAPYFTFDYVLVPKGSTQFKIN